MKHLICTALLAATAIVHAQPAPSASAPASAPTSPAKKALIQQFLTLQQTALESMVRNLVDQPARQLMGQAEAVLATRIAPEKREAVAAQVQESLLKYREETAQVAKDRTARIAQSGIGPMLDEKFSEDELRQLVGALEAPAYKKFQQSLPDITNAFTQKVVSDLRPTIDPKVAALEQSITKALGAPPPAAGGPKAAKPAAPAASKPAKK